MKNNPVQIPSDSLNKAFFSEKDIVESLLIHYVPKSIHQHLSYSTLKRVATERVTRKYRLRFEDMVWKAEGTDYSCFFFLSFEFQSSIEITMALRVATYSTLLLQDLVNEGEDPRNLPPIFPIVIYNGKEKWSAPETLQELRCPMPRMFRDYQTQQKYFLIDLNRFSDKDFEDNDCIVSDFFRINQMEWWVDA